jgi:hypothetical protein
VEAVAASGPASPFLSILKQGATSFVLMEKGFYEVQVLSTLAGFGYLAVTSKSLDLGLKTFLSQRISYDAL